MGKKLLPMLGNLIKTLDQKGGEALGKAFNKFDSWFIPKLQGGVQKLKDKEAAMRAEPAPPLFPQRAEAKTLATPTAQPKMETAKPLEIATPMPKPFSFNFKPHMTANTKRQDIYAPVDDTSLYQEFFPQEATSAAVAAFNESQYDPKTYHKNTNPSLKGTPYHGAYDMGYFQNNDVAVKDLFKFYPNTMKKLGLNSFKDWVDWDNTHTETINGKPRVIPSGKWSDKRTNFAVTKLYRDKFETRAGKKPWTSWYGWQDQGFQNVGNPNINYNQ